jgi:hypothetical protein
MRALVDIVQNVTSSIRFIIGAMVLLVFLIGLMLSASIAYVAPQAAETVAEKAETMGDKAIAAAQRQRVAEDMAEDGWGYGAATATTGQGAPEDGETGSSDDGWAD